jgi:ABC-2 type transport system ATP-binding protein
MNQVSFRYGDEVAVDNLSLNVKPGEIFGLVGPDGAGKTTIIRMLCGLLDPSSGQTEVLGFDTVQEKRQINNRIGYLSQRFSLYGDLTIEENIDFFAEIHEVRHYQARKQELLDFTRLAPFRTRLADKLSGGMKQKLALACTLIHSPNIIFLDEPTTGVDPVSRRDFWKILNNLLTTGLTIFMSTPYLDEAERCNRIALINQGRVIVCDTPKSIRLSFKSNFLEMVCSPVRQAALIGRQHPNLLSVQMFGDRIHIQYNADRMASAEIVHYFEQHGIVVAGVRELTPSLEDVFIQSISQGGNDHAA